MNPQNSSWEVYLSLIMGIQNRGYKKYLLFMRPSVFYF